MRTLGRIHDEDPIVPGATWLGADRPSLVPFPRGVHELAPEPRIAQPTLLLVERQRAELAPDREAVEGQVGPEREHDAERAAVDLGEHAAAGRRRPIEKIEVDTPDPRRFPPAEETPGYRAPGLDGQ